jgi:hypothetical protein
MSPNEVKTPAKEDHSLPLSSWVKASSVLFDVPPEVAQAALMGIVKDSDDPDAEPRFVREEVAKAVSDYMKAPATRG